MHHSDNKQTNKYKQNNINLYVYIKMKIASFISHEFDSFFIFFYFPLSCPYPGFFPSKSKLPLLSTPAVMDAVLISGQRLLLPLCLSSNNNTDVLNIPTYSFPTGKCSPSPSAPSMPPPWPVSVSSQHPAVGGGQPLSLYNLNCQTALWDSR